MKIKVKIHPASSKEKIKQKDKENYEIWIKEKAEDNKANIALVKMLKKHFKSEIKIKSGFSSRNKIIDVN
jgi:uncharacterized protein (TIGR00251 family)